MDFSLEKREKKNYCIATENKQQCKNERINESNYFCFKVILNYLI